MYFRIFIIFVCALNCAFSQFDSKYTNVKVFATSLPETEGEFYVAVTFTPKEGMHLYFENPGDAGMPPKATFLLPQKEDKASLLGYPAPVLHQKGKSTSYIYNKPFTFVYQLNVNSKIDPKTVQIELNWLVCKDTCIPEMLSLSLDQAEAISTKEVQSIVDSLPQNLFGGKVYQEGQEINIQFPKNMQVKSAYFFSSLPDQIQYDAEQVLSVVNYPELKIKTLGIVDKVEGYLQVTTDKGTETYIMDHEPFHEPILSSSNGLIWIVLFAFLGGLVLNLMPCVFPVLSLKILHLMNHAPTKADTLRHGLAYTSGVFISFMVLYAIITLLKLAGVSIGWGFQLQSPIMVCLLIIIFFILAINLFGLFEFSAFNPSEKFQENDQKQTYTSFLNGVLTTVVATPCTAPFMGTALAVALSQSNFKSFLIFFSLSFGLALPFLILCIFPNLLKRFPKPGPWMRTFKEILAFPMLGAVIWLLWVIDSLNPVIIIPLLLTLIVLLFIFWAYGVGQRTGKTWLTIHIVPLLIWMTLIRYTEKTPALFLIFYVCLIFSFLYITNKVIESFKIYTMKSLRILVLEFFLAFTLSYATLPLVKTFNPNEQIKHPLFYSKEIVDEALRNGQTVFINFTARWCITCQVNKLSVLESKAIQKIFKEREILYIEADWTHHNPVITKTLTEYNRESIPLYVILKPGKKDPIILPELLTENAVIEALS